VNPRLLAARQPADGQIELFLAKQEARRPSVSPSGASARRSGVSGSMKSRACSK
jgi:hypothetical protein